MTRKVYNIVRPREYTADNGQSKTAWSRHGILIIDDDKISIRLDSLPTSDWNGWLNCFERDDATAQAQPMSSTQNRQTAHVVEMDNDIPF